DVTVNIGIPYPSRSAFVMDRDGNEAPVGGLGELCIGGETLARGYVGKPGLTAERFVPDPTRPGGRLYRTGDLVRQRPDGVVDFLGRLDNQVKLRGFRIELGEIEAALRAAPGVRDAVAVIAGEGEHKHILAYAAGDADAGDLRSRLEQTLPGYMVPASVMVLDALPLMPNGKIDRKALPQPDGQAQRAIVAPRNETEARLLAVWKAVLKRDDIGVTDNFFMLGGTSLSALKVISLLEQSSAQRISLIDLLTYPTINGLSKKSSSADKRVPPFIHPLNRSHSRLRLFCLHPDYGIAIAYRELARTLDGTVSVFGVNSPFLPGISTIATDFNGLAKLYADHVQSIDAFGPYCLAGWSLGGWLAVQVAHELEARSAQVLFLGLIDTPVLSKSDRSDYSPDEKAQRLVQLDRYASLLAEMGIPPSNLPNIIADIVDRHIALFEGREFTAGTVGANIHCWKTLALSKRPSWTHDWSPFTRGEVLEAPVIDDTHLGIVTNRDFLKSFGDVFAHVAALDLAVTSA
ncbi:thioesterase domain-containing protein, partial [Agrobacterium tumefaciens]|uniref:thioesterase domain-containing protein n=1 Tax=Agrobacterium tumefaciens TaxID=358 RepID=UPI0022439DDB